MIDENPCELPRVKARLFFHILSKTGRISCGVLFWRGCDMIVLTAIIACYIINNHRRKKNMSNDNIYSKSILKAGVLPQVGTDNTAFESAIINVAGWSYLEWEIFIGTLADADTTAVVLVEGSNADDMTGAVAIPDEDLQGLEADAGFQFDDDGEVRKIGVKNLEYQYYQMTITPSNNTGDFPVCVGARLMGSNYEPVTQPAS